jgi:hypothetical protein
MLDTREGLRGDLTLDAQCCVGNIETARVHFDGLTTLLDIKDSICGGMWKGNDFENELAERAVML